MTRNEVEKAAQGLHSSGDRWRVWQLCGPHNLAILPKTESGEHYCSSCCTLFSPEGATLNEPERPDQAG